MLQSAAGQRGLAALCLLQPGLCLAFGYRGLSETTERNVALVCCADRSAVFFTLWPKRQNPLSPVNSRLKGPDADRAPAAG